MELPLRPQSASVISPTRRTETPARPHYDDLLGKDCTSASSRLFRVSSTLSRRFPIHAFDLALVDLNNQSFLFSPNTLLLFKKCLFSDGFIWLQSSNRFAELPPFSKCETFPRLPLFFSNINCTSY